ncbi:MAG: DUF4349 domain-containing protein [Rudanella sp.]|nr:DUF4349 domain-containing protein [Rudanella sp.]
MNSRLSPLLLIAGLILMGCQAKNSNEPSNEQAIGEADLMHLPPPPTQKGVDAPELPETPAPPPATNRKLVRNATLRFRVEKLTESEGRISKMAGQFGGMITNSEENRTGGLSEMSMTVRVPAARLDPFLVTLMKESIYTDTKTITAEDITRQYADTDARIRAKKATETRYLQLLQRARNVQEVMAVEAQLGQMREDIESQEAVLRTLKNDVALSTVTIAMYERGETATEPNAPFYVRAAQNFRDGFDFLGQFVVGAFYFVPLLLIIGAVWWGIRQWRNR